MDLSFQFGRTALALCVGSLLSAAASVSASELASEPAGTPDGVSAEIIRQHLASTLAEDSVLKPLPRNNERYSFDGRVRTYVVPVRPAIDNPMTGHSRFDSSSFRRDTVAAEFSNLGWLQAVYKRIAED